MELFNSVEQQGGFYGSITAKVSTVSGGVKNNNATLYLAGFLSWNNFLSANPGANITKDERRIQYDRGFNGMENNALTAIHELIHFNYSDVALAKAVASLNKDTQSTFSFKDIFAASKYWDDELRKHCKPVNNVGKIYNK